MANALFDLTMTYEYAGKEVTNFLELELEKRVKEEVREASELQPVADAMKRFAQQFVLANHTYDSGDLYRGIESKADRNQIRLWVPSSVKDSRGRYYAGHIEFGFHNWRNQSFVGPFPYLRPAMRYGADLTREDITADLVKIITGERFWWRGSRKNGEYMYGQMIGQRDPTPRLPFTKVPSRINDNKMGSYYRPGVPITNRPTRYSWGGRYSGKHESNIHTYSSMNKGRLGGRKRVYK